MDGTMFVKMAIGYVVTMSIFQHVWKDILAPTWERRERKVRRAIVIRHSPKGS
jgi:hypothetical protein